MSKAGGLSHESSESPLAPDKSLDYASVWRGVPRGVTIHCVKAKSMEHSVRSSILVQSLHYRSGWKHKLWSCISVTNRRATTKPWSGTLYQ